LRFTGLMTDSETITAMMDEKSGRSDPCFNIR
jgi:hypothetical protein